MSGLLRIAAGPISSPSALSGTVSSPFWEPATSAGILAKKLSNVYVQIKGLSAFVTVRGGDGEGGRIDIDENKAALIHGEREIN